MQSNWVINMYDDKQSCTDSGGMSFGIGMHKHK